MSTDLVLRPVLGRVSVVDRATHLGTRDSNEDYVLADEIDGTAIVVLADGVGGEPWGDKASRLACVWAIAFTRRALRAAQKRGQPPETQRIVRLAFRTAGRQLRREAIRHRRVAGLKTTLIVVVTVGDELTYGYVGDGGLWLASGDGTPLESLLAPMRSESGGELTAAMGPKRTALPCIGTRWLPARAVVVVATDGLADPIPTPSWQLIAQELMAAKRMQAVMRQLLEHCAGLRDQGEPVFTDNMTIAAIRRT